MNKPKLVPAQPQGATALARHAGKQTLHGASHGTGPKLGENIGFRQLYGRNLSDEAVLQLTRLQKCKDSFMGNA